MPFGSTITLTVDAVAKVLNRVNQDNYGSEYKLLTDVDSWVLKIRHSTDSPDGDGVTMLRHNVYLEHVTYPTPTTAIHKESLTFTLRAGSQDGVTTVTDIAQAFAVYLAAGTYAVIDDLVIGLN